MPKARLLPEIRSRIEALAPRFVLRTSQVLCVAIAGACVPEAVDRSSLDPTPPPRMEPPAAMQPDAGPPAMTPPPDDAPTWWQDVEPLMRSECALCHGDPTEFGAPMPIVAYEDVLVPAFSDPTKFVHEVIAARVQRNTGKPPMPPTANGTLTDDEIAMIQAWSDAGAPEGTPPVMNPDAGVVDSGSTPPPPPPPAPDAGSGPNPEEPYEYVTVTAPQAVVRGGTTDMYGCFRTIIQTDAPLHAVEIEVELDKTQVLHHILLFRDGGRNYPESRVGFRCSADTVLQRDWELLHGWAPGGDKMVLPPEAGVRLENGDHIVVQMHYNNPTTETVQDSSGMRFKVTRNLRTYDAAVLGVGTQRFSLPPGQPAVERSGECQFPQETKIFSYSPHMHLLGRGGRLQLNRGGQYTTVADVQDFAFESQIAYPIDLQLQAGDALKATCTWDTTSRVGDTGFGEGTEDEMCYMFVGHYPPFGRYSCGD